MMGTAKTGIVAAALVLASSGNIVCADALLLQGSSIPLQNVKILDIRSGRLYYDGPVGRRQWRELAEVVQVSFDDLETLDQAEQALEAGDDDQGLLKLLQAVLDSDEELARIWTRVRLVRFHKERKEFTHAASHAAAVFALRPEDSYWRYLEPMGEVDPPPYPAAYEALAALREAERKPLHRELQNAVERMRKAIAPVAKEVAESWQGEPLRQGATLSGYPIASIREGRLVAQTGNGPPVEAPDEATGDGDVAGDPARSSDARSESQQPAARQTPRDAPSEPMTGRTELPREDEAPPAAGSSSASSPDSPETIEALLQEGQHEQALAACQRVADRPGDRSVSLFLYQYGRALSGSGKPRDAAVMFMRCAILHDDSSWAPSCLLETGLIYGDVYRKQQTARRLLQRAQAMAGSQGDTETAQRARTALEELDQQ